MDNKRIGDEHRAEAYALPEKIADARGSVGMWIVGHRGQFGVPPHLGPADYDLDELIDDLILDARDLPASVANRVRHLEALQGQVLDYHLSLKEDLQNWFVANRGLSLDEFEILRIASRDSKDLSAEFPADVVKDLQSFRRLDDILRDEAYRSERLHRRTVADETDRAHIDAMVRRASRPPRR